VPLLPLEASQERISIRFIVTISVVVMRFIVGITGASGSIYGLRLLENLKKSGADVTIIASKTGLEILNMETGMGKEGLAPYGRLLDNQDLMAPMASGSNTFDAMVVAPCSMKTLACIANGLASSLMVRVAEVALKERRKLVLVTRETPLSLIDIKNMEMVTLAGGVVLPACPGFYHSPRTMEDLVDHVVGKVLDQIGVEHSLFKRWGK
jgi:4-hydroxy-3-polyprenylbenzoate decarboxylase